MDQEANKSDGQATTVITTIRKSGGSRIITLPAALLALTKWEEGQELELSIDGGDILVRPLKQLTLADLMAQVPEGGLPSLEQILGWSQPDQSAGNEILP